jgi:hypothetical protein
MGWSLKNISKQSGHPHAHTHNDPKMGKILIIFFFSRSETGRVKRKRVL